MRCNPSDDRSALGLGRAYLNLSRFSAAVAQFNHALEINARTSGVHYYRGLAQRTARTIPFALDDFDEALRRDSQDGMLHYQRAYAMRMLGRYRDAESESLSALELIPNSSMLHYRHGTILAEQGRNEEPKSFFMRALALNPLRHERCSRTVPSRIITERSTTVINGSSTSLIPASPMTIVHSCICDSGITIWRLRTTVPRHRDQSSRRCCPRTPRAGLLGRRLARHSGCRVCRVAPNLFGRSSGRGENQSRNRASVR